MGACASSKKESITDKDLPPPIVQGNVYQKFEKSLPFYCIYISVFKEKVHEAAELDQKMERGDGTTVTLDSLRLTLTTAAWDELKKDDSRVTKLITSDIFKADKDSDKISVTTLLLFGFHHCAGTVRNKSELLYDLFKEGNPEQTDL